MKNGIAGLCLVAVASLLLLPVPGSAQSTNCNNAVIAIPDGRLQESYNGTANTDHWFKFMARAGRSYSIEVWFQFGGGPVTLPEIFPAGNVNLQDCTVGASLPGVVNRIMDDPSMDTPSGSTAGVRRTFVVGNTTEILIRVHTSGTPGTYAVSLSETTLFSPAWSTFGTFETFYSCINTTNTTLNATLTLFTIAGAQVASFPLNNVATGTGVSTNTGPTALNVADSQNGFATLTHNGPAGAFLCEAAIANFAVAPGVIQPVKFEPVRQQR